MWFHRGQNEPTLAKTVSQPCTQSQCESPEFVYWCGKINLTPWYHRKLWEFCYILRVLDEAEMLRPGRSGVGFGVGREPLAAAMAVAGCRILATDMAEEGAVEQGWVVTGQHTGSLHDLNDKGICDPGIFQERVRYRTVNMNAIPADLGTFDFAWSACAMEHLGSLRHGLDFVRNSLTFLRPGGVAVHTTEFNLSSNRGTAADGPTVIYRRKDFAEFARALTAEGHEISLNFNAGSGPVDRYVDLPPYAQVKHLKLQLAGYVSTSFGLKIRKGRPPGAG